MSAEVEKTSHIEPGNMKMSGATISSPAPMGSQKVSMFAAKTGFVIPKNKLSGSLVPIFRVNKKSGGNESVNGENDKQAQRKTKWGPDLTQDTAVRKGRLIAYQTRLEQITELLKSGTLEVPETQDSALGAENVEDKSPGSQASDKVQNTELLELEKREVIGEILKLNPSYKAPPDYRPLLKEDRFPLPVKEYPGYNFIGLIYGPSGENQKRLEKETGVKMRICGIKAETGEKDEIKPTDGHETQNAYEELYVYMSADTFDKIDAAISVIELLITSISGNLTTGSTFSDLVSTEVSSSSQAEGTTISNIGQTPVPNQGVMQQVQVYAPTSVQGQFHYPSTWFPAGPSHNLTPAPGFISPQNPPSVRNNPIHLSTPTSNISNVPSSFARPPTQIPFNPAFHGPPVHPPRQQLPVQDLQQPFMTQTSHVGQSRVHGLTIQRPPLVQSNVSNPNFTGSGPLPSGLLPNMPGSAVPSSIPPASLPDRPLAPIMVSTGFSGPTVGGSASVGPNNMGQTALSLAPPLGPHTALPHGVNSSGAAPANMDVYSSFPSGPSNPQATGVHTNRPIAAPVPSPQMGHRPPFSVPSAHNPAGNFIAGSASNLPTPPTNTSNFTFQPRGPQNPPTQTILNLNIQNPSTVPTLQHPASGAPSYHPAGPNFPRVGNQPFPGPQAGSQIGNNQIQEIAASHPIGMQASPRLPAFLDPGPRTPLHQRNFSPAMQMPNLPGNFPHRPGNPMQLEQGFPIRATRPEVRFAPPQFGGNLTFCSGKPPPSSGGQQIYDPFSPTSVSGAQQQGRNPAK
ncbi:branchpoint-bridging protein isoform X2 [Momordica charantia]|uniref:Branchpoint-bridging protein isoform X2 n=1 Tax=Momordica charantia TaxID=3673 RepID=A0A6J1DII6_MOMCH|nr:branchpoint-bridging protein isoform X2 [Momordica charantia]